MTFLISLALALLFVALLGRTLRAHPVPFYLAAVGIAVVVAVVTWAGVSLPAGFSKWVWPVFARGGLAGGLFVLVMFAGAFPNGSVPSRRLMPIRGPLSILASILTLGHNAAFGKTYFTLLFTSPAQLPLNQLLAAICSIVMLLIMLPLFVTSFQRVRRKMAPKQWKALQRLAYGFYALLYCHILLLSLPQALAGSGAYQLTVFVYSAVFLSYAVCRVLKAAARRKKTMSTLPRRQLGSAACCVAAVLVVVLCLPAKGMASGAEGSAGGYADGVYSGSAMGMNAQIAVSVTIRDNTITDIAIDSHREDEPYFTDALAVIDDILDTNSLEVDTVSGATYSSGGILDAVADALSQAVR
ncbi:MAG: FMN-binding protein [Evtepia sp.]